MTVQVICKIACIYFYVTKCVQKGEISVYIVVEYYRRYQCKNLLFHAEACASYSLCKVREFKHSILFYSHTNTHVLGALIIFSYVIHNYIPRQCIQNHSEPKEGTENSPQTRKIPIFASSYHSGSGRVSKESHVG